MARHVDETFGDGQRVPLDGDEFIRCRFNDCLLVFTGEGPIVMDGNVFGPAVKWTFDGPAARTLQFLAALYHGAGDGGRGLVEETFATIRRSRPSNK